MINSIKIVNNDNLLHLQIISKETFTFQMYTHIQVPSIKDIFSWIFHKELLFWEGNFPLYVWSELMNNFFY